jgi:DNA-directed RNA polymerase III subunit RPC5
MYNKLQCMTNSHAPIRLSYLTAAPPVPMADVDADDYVVRELDVYIANDLHAASTQLSLCQFPLRPPWRPYDMDQVSSVRFKNDAQRLEIDVPVAKDAQNYNQDVESFKQIPNITLRSSQVETNTSYAVGVLAGDKMILAPVDYCLQLRPTMTHLPAAKKASNDESDEEDQDEQDELAAVEVQVKKRETERQQMQRLNSYAFMSQKEEDEQWLKLNVHASGTAVSDNIWTSFVKPTETDVGIPMDLKSYLACVVPQKSDTSSEHPDSTHSAPVASASAPEQAKASPEALQALPKALAAMFEKQKICSMAIVRQFLLDNAAAGPAKSVVSLTDRALHEAVIASGNIVCIRRVYIQQKTGKPDVDQLRAIVLDLLKEKESFRRADVMDVVKTVKKLEVNDTLYNKVVKELCFSRGNQWLLKSSSDI